MLSPELDGLPKFAQKPILWVIFVAKPPTGLGTFAKVDSFIKMSHFPFYKVFTEIGSLGFTEFGRASERTDVSK